MVHLGPFRKKKAKSAIVLVLAVGLLYYTLHSPHFTMLNEATIAVFFNKTGTDILQQRQTISDNSTQSFFNSTNTSLPVFTNLTTAKSPVQRRLISVELVGAARLGNLMFGHASMLGMANKTGLDPIVSERNRLLLNSFDLGTAHEAIRTSEWLTCNEQFASAYDETFIGKILQHPDRNALMFGYFQSWRYFDHIRLRIIKEFQFKSQFRDSASKFVEAATRRHYPGSIQNETLRNNILRIGIHVRRGDMLATSSVHKGFTVADAGYLARAMAYLEKVLHNTHSYLMYIVVSDDITWCRKNIVSTTHPIEFGAVNNGPEVDLAILASCNHTIATVGTFSWWAGYLAGGITVYYKNFPANGSEIASVFHAEDYFPPTWIGLS